MSADTQRGERDRNTQRRQALESVIAEMRRRFLTMAPGERDAAFTVGFEAPRQEGEAPRVRVVKA